MLPKIAPIAAQNADVARVSPACGPRTAINARAMAALNIAPFSACLRFSRNIFAAQIGRLKSAFSHTRRLLLVAVCAVFALPAVRALAGFETVARRFEPLVYDGVAAFRAPADIRDERFEIDPVTATALLATPVPAFLLARSLRISGLDAASERFFIV